MSTSPDSSVPRFGAVIVGDEILSGKRKDGHLPFTIEALEKRAAKLEWTRYVGDSMDLQAQCYRETLASGCIVFSFGGIGATPDDLSRQAAAQAFGQELEYHPEGMDIMRARFGEAFNHRRRQLVRFPRDAALIPNPVNQVPGFSLMNHHFVPGFPSMAHPMVEWVLDTWYKNVLNGPRHIEYGLRTRQAHESDLIPHIEQVLAEFEGIKLSSLPGNNRVGQVELAVRAEARPAKQAFRRLRELLDTAGIEYQLLP